MVLNTYGQVADKWKSYSERVNTRTTLSFLYPNNTIVSSEENSRCIVAKVNSEKLDWCIWLSDSSQCNASQSIDDEKNLIEGQVNIYRDTILIDNIKCLRVTFKSDSAKEPERQIVFLTKLGTALEIIKRSGVNTDFNKFCTTITLIRTEEKLKN